MADGRLLLVGALPPPAGGIAIHITTLLHTLRRRGIQVGAVEPRSRLAFAMALGRAAANGTRVHAHVCGHNLTSYAVLGACLAAARPGRPPIMTLHSGMAAGFLAGLSPAGRAAVAGLLKRAGAVVCVNARLAEAVRALGVGPGHLLVASPFVGARAGRPPARVVGARASTRLLVAAAVAPGAEYGADVLAAGFACLAARHGDALLVVYGPGGADRAVARELEARGLGERCLAAGELDHASALGAVALADVFVRPTRADGDALSVREALALGRRAVASDAAPRPPGTEIFPAGDPHALAGAVLTAVRRPSGPAVADAAGFLALWRLYRRLGVIEEVACAELPAA